MSELHLPWIELALAFLAGGAAWTACADAPETARRRALVSASLGLAAVLGAWGDFLALGVAAAADGVGLCASVLGESAFVVDELSAPILPLTALIYLVVAATTLQTKVRRFSFARTLILEALVLSMFAAREPWLIVASFSATAVPVAVELRIRRRPARVHDVHQVAAAACLIAGWVLVDAGDPAAAGSQAGFGLMALAAAIRCGLVPAHCWVTDLFEKGALGTALVAMTPITGACVAWRLLVPHAPAWVLGGLAAAGLITAVYAAAMSLIQTSARRFYCFAFLSHSALVMSGLDPASGISLTASLYLWLSVSLAFTGLGLAVRSLEARTGRLSLKEFQGFQSQTPLLAALFLVAGLAAVGFPGTVGFFGLDLLVEGASEGSPGAGVAIVAAAALNGIGILRAYSALFLGARHPGTVNLRCRPAERLAVLALVALVLGGSIYPQSVVRSRADAARAVLESREGGLPRRDGVTP